MLRQLRNHQVLSVHELMEMFDCSHMTIRRNTALLEHQLQIGLYAPKGRPFCQQFTGAALSVAPSTCMNNAVIVGGPDGKWTLTARDQAPVRPENIASESASACARSALSCSSPRTNRALSSRPEHHGYRRSFSQRYLPQAYTEHQIGRGHYRQDQSGLVVNHAPSPLRRTVDRTSARQKRHEV
jgi:hypothetical protein